MQDNVFYDCFSLKMFHNGWFTERCIVEILSQLTVPPVPAFQHLVQFQRGGDLKKIVWRMKSANFLSGVFLLHELDKFLSRIAFKNDDKLTGLYWADKTMMMMGYVNAPPCSK